MTTQVYTLTRDQVNAAISQAVLTAQGINPTTPGLTVMVRFNEEHEVFPPSTWRINVTVATP